MIPRLTAAAAAAALLFVGLAPQAVAAPQEPPSTVFSASDLPVGEIRSTTQHGAFTLHATESAHMTVTEHSRSSDQGHEFTQRLQLGGSGSSTQRSVEFQAEEGQTVTFYAQSGSGTDDRRLALYDESWTELDQRPAFRGESGNVLPAQTFQVAEDGTYWIASPASGVNLYYLEVSDAGQAPERLPWDQVSTPVITGTEVSTDKPGTIEVSYTAEIGPAGGDVLRAFLRDAEDEVIDEQISVSPGSAGTIALTPEASGDYEITIQLERHAETEPLVSDATSLTGFQLPLEAPVITSSLTTAVNGDHAAVTLQWNQVPEAQTYSVGLRTSAETEFTTVARDLEDAHAELQSLSVGQTYEAQVTAHRGDGEEASSSVSEPVTFTVSGEVQRWDIAHAGVGSRGEVTIHDSGDIEFDLRGNNSKVADSEDGFWYYYTQVDPQNENFTLTASFRVDDSSGKDNQSGFGVIAIDDFIPGNVASRYFNSAGAMVAKYEYGAGGEEGVRYGTPGGKFVHGYTGSSTEASSNRTLSDSRAFDWEYKPDYTFGSNTNPPRFQDGETYTLTLRRSNTGFHSIWHRGDQDEDPEVIYYDPDFLLTQNEDHFYVGLAVARDIAVTVTDWEFSTIHPDDDAAAQEAPTRYLKPQLNSDITPTTPHTEIQVPAVTNVYGDVVVLDEQGQEVTETVSIEPGAQESLELSGLAPGENQFTMRLDIAEDQPQLQENEELSSTEPVELPLTFTVHAYGKPGQSIWVAPDGSPEGTGTPQDPLDVHTAVAYAQPGQQVVLQDGTYAIERALRIERGNSGTEDAPIILMSEPGTRATFDLSNSTGGGIILRGDWWHLYNLEITAAPPSQKPLHIQGHHNVIERVESHHNQDTGVQISGLATEPSSMWPSYNTVVSSESHNNADPQSNDADGFAAKLTAGEGNVFRWTISHHNIDDGYDLYAKSTEGPIGTVLIEESVAYHNGRLEDDPTAERSSDGQGFKMGGESMPGDHLLRNSIAYGNLGNGVASNSGPNIRLENVTSVFNHQVRPDRTGGNVSLRTNATWTDYQATGVISFGASGSDSIELRDQEDDFLHDPTNYFNGQLSGQASAALIGGAGGFSLAPSDDRPTQVEEDWFVSTDYQEIRPEIAEDGSIEMNGLFALTDAAPADTGARLNSNPDPTVIELLPAVAVSAPGADDEADDAADPEDGPDPEEGATPGGDSGSGSEVAGPDAGEGTGAEGGTAADADSAGDSVELDGSAEQLIPAGESAAGAAGGDPVVGALARTGSDVTPVVAVLAALLLGGLASVLLSRRSRVANSRS